MRQGRTTSMKVYVIVYHDEKGVSQHIILAGRNGQEAVDTFRQWTENKYEVFTIARVSNDWR